MHDIIDSEEEEDEDNNNVTEFYASDMDEDNESITSSVYNVRHTYYSHRPFSSLLFIIARIGTRFSFNG
jgi:hypothetical protein